MAEFPQGSIAVGDTIVVPLPSTGKVPGAQTFPVMPWDYDPAGEYLSFVETIDPQTRFICAECENYAADDDYLCGDCRA